MEAPCLGAGSVQGKSATSAWGSRHWQCRQIGFVCGSGEERAQRGPCEGDRSRTWGSQQPSADAPACVLQRRGGGDSSSDGDDTPLPAVNLSNRLNPNNVHFDRELAAMYKRMSKHEKVRPSALHVTSHAAAQRLALSALGLAAC